MVELPKPFADPVRESFRSYIAELIGRRGVSVRAVEQYAGVSDAALRKFLSGGRWISADNLQKLADYFHLDFTELWRRSRGEPVTPPARGVGPVVLVPIVNVTLAAGAPSYGETGEAVPVPAELVQGRRLVAARVTGDRMEPEVKPGDVAVVDIHDKAPRAGDLVAVLVEDGNMQIERFERDGIGPLLLDNRGGRYRPNGAKVQGVVVYVGRAYR